MKKLVNLNLASLCRTYYSEWQHYKNGYSGCKYVKGKLRGECGFSCRKKKLLNTLVSVKSFPVTSQHIIQMQGYRTFFTEQYNLTIVNESCFRRSR